MTSEHADSGPSEVTRDKPLRYLRKLGWLSIAGNTVNEDGGGARSDAAWLLDGATGLQKDRLLPGASDAAWLVAEACAFFEGLLRITSTPGILKDLSLFIASRFNCMMIPEASQAASTEPPSASLSFVNIRNNLVTLANIGDCRTFIKEPGQPTIEFGDSPVTALDAQLVQRLVDLQQSEPHSSYQTLWSQLVPYIRCNRSLKNKPNGYWVIDPTQEWLDHVQYSTMGVQSGTHILIVSDGFYRLVDHYRIYDKDSLIAAVMNEGLDSLARHLRRIEDADLECRLYPRLKRRDDASALLLEVATSTDNGALA